MFCLPYLSRRRPVRRIFRLRTPRRVNPPKLRLAPLPSGFLPQTQPPAAPACRVRSAASFVLSSAGSCPPQAGAPAVAVSCPMPPFSTVKREYAPPALSRIRRRRVGLQSVMTICPNGVFRDQPDELFDAPGVELVEQVVEQQDRASRLSSCATIGVLGQFQGDQERLLLALRAVFAQGVAADPEHQIVAVNARRGELVGHDPSAARRAESHSNGRSFSSDL